MRIAVIDNGTDCLPKISKLCNISGHSFDVLPIDQLSEVDLYPYDLTVLTGGLWFDDPTIHELHYGKELGLIAQNSTPILGICLGAQLIASAFGGVLMPLKHYARGNTDITLTEKGKELLDWSDDIKVYENHTIGIVQLPPQLESLAYSEECIEIVKHKSLPIVGVQFHPELTDKKESAIIWNSLIHKVCKISQDYTSIKT